MHRTIAAGVFAAALALGAGSARAEPEGRDWTGFYAGLHMGAGIAEGAGTGSSLNPALPGHSSHTGSQSFAGFIGGGQFGYNRMLPSRLVLGFEGDASGGAMSKTFPETSTDGTSFKTASVKALGGLRARAGYGFERVLVYGTSGLAWGHVSSTNVQGPCSPDPTCASPGAVPLGTKFSIRVNMIGWSIGAGAELALRERWTAKFEYLYEDLGRVKYSMPVFNRNNNIALSLHVLRAGLNYKFG